MNFSNKRYWLVGASEGLGRALAVALAGAGARLILSARNTDRLHQLAAELPGQQHDVIAFDLRDKDAVADAHQKAGDYDGVIYAAGVYWPMRAQDWDVDRAEAMIDINFAGGARILGPAARHFAARDEGHIVVIGSLSGFRGLRGASGYGASKAGLMHLAENLQADLHRTGVKVQLINPGFIKTRLTDKNEFPMPFIMSPDVAAQHVLRAMHSGRFQSNFPRVFSWLFRGANFLPAGLYYRLFGARE